MSSLVELLDSPYMDAAPLTEWQFVGVPGGVHLKRGYLESTPLDDDPLVFRAATITGWIERQGLDPVEDGFRLSLAALTSDGLPQGRRLRVAMQIAAASHHAVQLRIADEDVVARAWAPALAQLRWHLIRTAASSPGSDLWIWAVPLFGSSDRMLAEARIMRVEWLTYLLEYEDHPLLSGIDVDTEAAHMMQLDITRSNAEAPRRKAKLRDSEEVFRAHVARELLARRFHLGELWTVARTKVQWAIGAVFALVPILVGLAAVLDTGAILWSALGVGLLGYGITAVAVATQDEIVSYPLLLRFAAGTVIGVLFIASIPSEWISHVEGEKVLGFPLWLPTTVFLLLIALAYLIVEVRLHGSRGIKAVRRAVAAELTGLVHGLVGAVAYVLLLAPALGATELTGTSVAGKTTIALTVGAGAVVAGVFLQVLWEDRPVSYPLGALRFRR